MKFAVALGAASIFCAIGVAHGADLLDDPLVYSSASFDWTGFYAGVNGGYGWASAKSIYGPIDPHGPMIGADIGYNLDLGAVVLGAEADLQWSGMRGSYTLPAGIELSGSVDYFGTVRGRAGVDLDRFLPYVTAGVSYAHLSGTSTTGPGYTTALSAVGWTVGAGLDYAVTDNVALRAEYLYTDYGSIEYFGGTPVAEKIHSSFGAARVGVNFKF